MEEASRSFTCDRLFIAKGYIYLNRYTEGRESRFIRGLHLQCVLKRDQSLLLCTTHEPGSVLHWTQVHITEAVAVAVALAVALAVAVALALAEALAVAVALVVALAVASHITGSSFLRVTST
jgi:hypothetical protein